MGRNFSQYALKSFFDIKLVQVKRGGGIRRGERERERKGMTAGILRDKTMDDKLKYIPNDDK